MARLHKTPYAMPSQDLPIDEYIEKSEEALANIPADKLYQETYADGYAYYKVLSFKPLILQHVPFLDAWSLPARTIRGLTVADVKTNINMRISFEKMMEGNS
jgi:hypothetical protein